MPRSSTKAITFAFSLLVTAAAYAASLTGSVKDPSGAALSGVTIEIRSVPPVGSPKTLHADPSGAFHLDGLPAGHYRLRVAQSGFEPFEADVTLDDGKAANVDVQLRVAGAHDVIQVLGLRHQLTDSVYHGMRESALADTLQVDNVVLHRDTELSRSRAELSHSPPRRRATM